MKAQYAYTPTPPGAIGPALNAIFASMTGQERAVYRRSANSNFIAIGGSPSAVGCIEGLLETLCLAHPSRFFVTFVDPALPALKSEISARCHLLSKSENICSEVVRIASPAASFSAVPGIIRANLLTGMPCELFICDPDVPRVMLQSIQSLADQIIYDSAAFERRLDLLRALEQADQHLVDLQWIGLGPWRDEIKNVFSRPSLAAELPHLSEIIVTAEVAEGSPNASCALLLSGWIADRLRLASRGRADGSHAFTHPDGGEVLLRSVRRPAAASRLSSVELMFGGTSGARVVVSAGESLQISVEGAERFHLTRALDEDTQVSRLERYFLIGESLFNYRSALRLGLALGEPGAGNRSTEG